MESVEYRHSVPLNRLRGETKNAKDESRNVSAFVAIKKRKECAELTDEKVSDFHAFLHEGKTLFIG